MVRWPVSSTEIDGSSTAHGSHSTHHFVCLGREETDSLPGAFTGAPDLGLKRKVCRCTADCRPDHVNDANVLHQLWDRSDHLLIVVPGLLAVPRPGRRVDNYSDVDQRQVVRLPIPRRVVYSCSLIALCKRVFPQTPRKLDLIKPL